MHFYNTMRDFILKARPHGVKSRFLSFIGDVVHVIGMIVALLMFPGVDQVRPPRRGVGEDVAGKITFGDADLCDFAAFGQQVQ